MCYCMRWFRLSCNIWNVWPVVLKSIRYQVPYVVCSPIEVGIYIQTLLCCLVWPFLSVTDSQLYQRATLSVWFSGDVIDSHGIGLCLSDSWLDASTTHQPPPHAGAGNSSCFAASSPVRVPYVPLPRRRHTSVSESRWMQGMPNATWERLVFFFSFATERLVFLCDSMTGVKPNKVIV